MAVNKRKVLDAARKYAQKGAKERALKEYNTLLKLDPKDAKLRLEVGDAHRRWGQVDEAIAQYLKVADEYQVGGFDARAVAVYKQILNLDAKRYSAYISLSELYQRMGLDAEAVQALQTAADGYHKEGKKREALELLRKMATLDPSNTTSRLKVAELLRQEGMDDDAIAEYSEVAAELKRQGVLDQVPSVYERIIEIEPERIEALLDLARFLIDRNEPGAAEPYAKRAADISSDDAEALELLCEVYKALERDVELAEVTRAVAKIYRDRGEDDRAREMLQRLPTTAEMSDESSADDSDLSDFGTFGADDEPLLGDDELLASDEFLAPPEDLGGPAAGPADSAEDAALLDEAPDELPEGDPEQLLAEASVYLRYGKRDQAIASLKAVIAQEPDNRGALEKLGEAYAEAGETPLAVEMWTRAARNAEAAGETSDYDILRDRIAALDPDAASALPAHVGSDDGPDLSDLEVDLDNGPEDSLGDSGTSLSLDDGDGIEIDLSDDGGAPDDPLTDSREIEIDLDMSGPDPSDSATNEEAEAGTDDVDIDIDIDDLDESIAAPDPAAPAAAPAGEDLTESVLIDDEDLDLTIDVDEDEAVALEAPPPSASQSQGASSASGPQVAEELEEAEFYFQQGLLDEAEAVYRRILKIAPSHPSALLRMGEIAVARDEEGTPDADAAGAAPPAVDELDDEDDTSPDLDLQSEDDFDGAAGMPDGAATKVELGDEPDLSDELEVDDLGADAGDSSSLSTPTLVDEAPPAPAAASAPPATPALLSQDTEDEDDSFDLAAELSDAFEESPSAPTDESVLSNVEDDTLGSLFADFKRGVTATLSESDYETRYDLGIAYKEMELHEDAIGEFRICLSCPQRRADSLNLMGICALDLGRGEDAVNHLQQALSESDQPADWQAGVYWSLAAAFRMLGDPGRERSALESVHAIDPGFPGVGERLAELDAEAPSAPDLAEPAEYESLDDIVSEAESDSESFESFDDLITDAEADEPPPEPNRPDPPPAAPASEDKADRPKPGRKKKISFV